MLNKFSRLSCILIIFFYSGFLHAQSQDFSVFQLRFLYNEAKFNDVISQGQQLLKNPNELKSADLREIHKYLALAFYNIAQQDSSRFHFYSVLSLNAEFELDPVTTSPKILSFFSDLKSSFNTQKTDQNVVKYKEYIFVEDIRPKTALRSLVLPGWGQFYKEQDTKGYIFGGAFLTTSLSAGITYLMEKNLKDDYLNETNPAKIKNRYNDYNNMSKVRKTLQYTAIIIWLASVSDALFSEYVPQVEVANSEMGISLYIPL